MAILEFHFSRSTALSSTGICWLTHSDWSHVSLVERGIGLWSASGPDKKTKWRDGSGRLVSDIGGVRCRPFDAWPYAYPPKVARIQCSEDVAARTFEWAKQQEGKPFDQDAIYAFLHRRLGRPSRKYARDWRDPVKWFCAEYCLRAPEIGGLFPHQLITPRNEVTPNDDLIYFNPYMTNVEDFL